ncbi:MAG: family 20 glycosylhydrolase [Prevotella sp.]|nr:family 20 glycosylhydrolase [Prevotella sp.]MDY5666820.1 family 20 glycosylhydrolase [Alloprevotella sp.]
MKHIYIPLLAFATCYATQAMAKVSDLLPRPQVIQTTQGVSPFMLKRDICLTDPTNNPTLLRFLHDTGCTNTPSASAKIVVEMVETITNSYDYPLNGFDNEAYSITITPNEVHIKAINPIGVTRAAQTLAQLAEGYDNGQTPALEALSMTDWPAFKLRGWMQDVGRSFLSFDELKKEIDLLSRFKVNVFHWHLTEKLAWRFEVKKYPQLTANENMIRYPGQYYTQAQCKELEAYAAERGVTIIPEIDMPGHSDVFTKAMGFTMQTDKGIAALKDILDEVANTFTLAPYIHIGGDEVTLNDGFLEGMTAYVRNTLKRKVVTWNPLKNKAVASDKADMTQMWSTRGNKIAGLPNIDCRYNYTNHFDVYADLVGIYKSNIYYAQKGDAELAGTISAAWNDTKVPTEQDIIKQNNQYANILASAERAWIGGGKQYIEVGGTTLPNKGDEFDEFADFERRFLFHKAHSLKNEPIPYVKQTNVHWRITEPFPNGGDANKVFPPELNQDEVMPTKYVYNNNLYRTSFATGAGIYLRHIWHSTVPSFLSHPTDNQTAYAWTYVYSPKEQQVGAQIEFYTYSRSGDDTAPIAGQWDRRGSKIWLNGNEIPAPQWQQAGKTIKQDQATTGLTNENFTNREPVALTLKQGWNKVFIKLPHANKGGTSRDKWQFTFVITDTEGKNALDGIIYSPDKSMDDVVPDNEDLSRPLMSDNSYTYWYTFCTPKRGTRYPTSSGANTDIVGQTTPTEASQWKFVSRSDGSFDIINRADNTYISPQANNNSALKTVSIQPSTGWNISKTVSGYYIVYSGSTQMNQTNNSQLGYKVYNWGYGTKVKDEYRTDDDGCLYTFNMTEVVTNDEQPKVTTPLLSNHETNHWYRFSSARESYRYPTSHGNGQTVTGELNNYTQASEWKFESRTDGTFNIVNRADGLYLSPAAEYNKALTTTSTLPADGWKFLACDNDKYFLIVSDGNHTEINQTKSEQKYQLFNWGYNSLKDNKYRFNDTGCQFSFTLTESEGASTAIATALSTTDSSIRIVNGRIYCNLPYRLYTLDGKALPIGRQLPSGAYLVRTMQGCSKVVIK